VNRLSVVVCVAEVDFKTMQPCHATHQSHIYQVVIYTDIWESGAAFQLESCEDVSFYARNESGLKHR
jgi:hypothetical protein